MTDRNELLKKRIENFAVNCIKLANKLPLTASNQPISSQFIRSATSVGANYQEACEGESAKDFVHKIKISKKETKETIYWLRLLYRTNIQLHDELSILGKEANELTKIFSSIVSKFKK